VGQDAALRPLLLRDSLTCIFFIALNLFLSIFYFY
jgi:hypothetical protein